MHEYRVEVDGIAARVYDPGEAPGLLLLGHGGGRSKDGDRFVALSRQYAAATGLAVLCMDAVDHGERKPPDATPGLPERWHSRATPQMVSDWTACAASQSSIGPALAYVGFSMGAIFGVPTVAAMPSIRAAVFVVGGLPTGREFHDPPLRQLLLDGAAQLKAPSVLMVNMTLDETFSAAGAQMLFDAIASPDKRITFWDGQHDDWPAEAIDQSAVFVAEHTRPA